MPAKAPNRGVGLGVGVAAMTASVGTDDGGTVVPGALGVLVHEPIAVDIAANPRVISPQRRSRIANRKTVARCGPQVYRTLVDRKDGRRLQPDLHRPAAGAENTGGLHCRLCAIRGKWLG